MVDSDTRGEFVSTVRKLLDRRSDSEAVRKAVETESGHDPALWATLAEIGLPGMLVPEEQGGVGGSFVDIASMMVEIGGHLYPGPFLGSAVLAPTALLTVADRAGPVDECLRRLADGSITGAVLIAGEGTTEVREYGDGGVVLRGSTSFVVDATRADLLVVVCPHADRARLAILRADHPRIRVERQRVYDLTRDVAAVRFDEVEVPAECAAWGGLSADRLRQLIFDAGSTALAADSLGIGLRVLEMCVTYAKTRHQFGRAIGSFQAIKHMCADMFVAVQASRAAVEAAAQQLSVNPTGSSRAVSIAKSQSCHAAVQIAGDAIQLHGGIGYTWEHDCHFFLKRAKLNAALFGCTRDHHERIVASERNGHV